MNILYLNHYAGTPALGMEYRPYYLAREWVRAGHRVQVLAANFSHVRAAQPDALVAYWRRLRDDDGTLLYPDAFLVIADDLGLMPPVEREVLRMACEQAVRWRDDGHDLSVSINVCGTQLAKIEDLEAAIGKVLKRQLREEWTRGS